VLVKTELLSKDTYNTADCIIRIGTKTVTRPTVEPTPVPTAVPTEQPTVTPLPTP
jgi:hypothetical protein